MNNKAIISDVSENKEAIRIAKQNAVTAFNESIGAFVKSMNAQTEKEPQTFLENLWTYGISLPFSKVYDLFKGGLDSVVDFGSTILYIGGSLVNNVAKAFVPPDGVNYLENFGDRASKAITDFAVDTAESIASSAISLGAVFTSNDEWAFGEKGLATQLRDLANQQRASSIGGRPAGSYDKNVAEAMIENDTLGFIKTFKKSIIPNLNQTAKDAIGDALDVMFLNVHKNAQEELGQERWFQTLTGVTESIGAVLAAWLVGKIGGQNFNLSAAGQKTLATTYFASKVYGQSHTEAVQNGASLQDAHLYALTNALIETGLENMGGFKAFGIDDVQKTGLFGKLKQTTGFGLIKNMAEEGLEEVGSEFLTQGLGIYSEPDHKIEQQTTEELLQKSFYSFVTGAMSSAFLSAGHGMYFDTTVEGSAAKIEGQFQKYIGSDETQTQKRTKKVVTGLSNMAANLNNPSALGLKTNKNGGQYSGVLTLKEKRDFLDKSGYGNYITEKDGKFILRDGINENMSKDFFKNRIDGKVVDDGIYATNVRATELSESDDKNKKPVTLLKKEEANKNKVWKRALNIVENSKVGMVLYKDNSKDANTGFLGNNGAIYINVSRLDSNNIEQVIFKHEMVHKIKTQQPALFDKIGKYMNKLIKIDFSSDMEKLVNIDVSYKSEEVGKVLKNNGYEAQLRQSFEGYLFELLEGKDISKLSKEEAKEILTEALEYTKEESVAYFVESVLDGDAFFKVVAKEDFESMVSFKRTILDLAGEKANKKTVEKMEKAFAKATKKIVEMKTIFKEVFDFAFNGKQIKPFKTTLVDKYGELSIFKALIESGTSEEIVLEHNNEKIRMKKEEIFNPHFLINSDVLPKRKHLKDFPSFYDNFRNEFTFKTTEINIYKKLIEKLEEEFTKLYDSKSFAAIDETRPSIKKEIENKKELIWQKLELVEKIKNLINTKTFADYYGKRIIPTINRKDDPEAYDLGKIFVLSIFNSDFLEKRDATLLQNYDNYDIDVLNRISAREIKYNQLYISEEDYRNFMDAIAKRINSKVGDYFLGINNNENSRVIPVSFKASRFGGGSSVARFKLAPFREFETVFDMKDTYVDILKMILSIYDSKNEKNVREIRSLIPHIKFDHTSINDYLKNKDAVEFLDATVFFEISDEFYDEQIKKYIEEKANINIKQANYVMPDISNIVTELDEKSKKIVKDVLGKTIESRMRFFVDTIFSFGGLENVNYKIDGKGDFVFPDITSKNTVETQEIKDKIRMLFNVMKRLDIINDFDDYVSILDDSAPDFYTIKIKDNKLKKDTEKTIFNMVEESNKKIEEINNNDEYYKKDGKVVTVFVKYPRRFSNDEANIYTEDFNGFSTGVFALKMKNPLETKTPLEQITQEDINKAKTQGYDGFTKDTDILAFDNVMVDELYKNNASIIEQVLGTIKKQIKPSPDLAMYFKLGNDQSNDIDTIISKDVMFINSSKPENFINVFSPDFYKNERIDEGYIIEQIKTNVRFSKGDIQVVLLPATWYNNKRLYDKIRSNANKSNFYLDYQEMLEGLHSNLGSTFEKKQKIKQVLMIFKEGVKTGIIPTYDEFALPEWKKPENYFSNFKTATVVGNLERKQNKVEQLDQNFKKYKGFYFLLQTSKKDTDFNKEKHETSKTLNLGSNDYAWVTPQTIVKSDIHNFFRIVESLDLNKLAEKGRSLKRGFTLDDLMNEMLNINERIKKKRRNSVLSDENGRLLKFFRGTKNVYESFWTESERKFGYKLVNDFALEENKGEIYEYNIYSEKPLDLVDDFYNSKFILEDIMRSVDPDLFEKTFGTELKRDGKEEKIVNFINQNPVVLKKMRENGFDCLCLESGGLNLSSTRKTVIPADNRKVKVAKKNYGFNYMGSKGAHSDIIEAVLSLHKDKKYFIDMFSGGFGASHYVLDTTDKRIIYNDINEYTVAFTSFLNDTTVEKFRELVKDFVTREKYIEIINNPKKYSNIYVGAIKSIYSFMNNEYTYGKYDTQKQEKAHFDLITKNKIDYEQRHIENIIRCDDLILSAQKKKNVLSKGFNLDWKDFLMQLDDEVLENAVFYCDIPYEDTTGYDSDFNVADFQEWYKETSLPVFVSSYSFMGEESIFSKKRVKLKKKQGDDNLYYNYNNRVVTKPKSFYPFEPYQVALIKKGTFIKKKRKFVAQSEKLSEKSISEFKAIFGDSKALELLREVNGKVMFKSIEYDTRVKSNIKTLVDGQNKKITYNNKEYAFSLSEGIAKKYTFNSEEFSKTNIGKIAKRSELTETNKYIDALLENSNINYVFLDNTTSGVVGFSHSENGVDVIYINNNPSKNKDINKVLSEIKRIHYYNVFSKASRLNQQKLAEAILNLIFDDKKQPTNSFVLFLDDFKEMIASSGFTNVMKNVFLKQSKKTVTTETIYDALQMFVTGTAVKGISQDEMKTIVEETLAFFTTYMFNDEKFLQETIQTDSIPPVIQKVLINSYNDLSYGEDGVVFRKAKNVLKDFYMNYINKVKNTQGKFLFQTAFNTNDLNLFISDFTNKKYRTVSSLIKAGDMNVINNVVLLAQEFSKLAPDLAQRFKDLETEFRTYKTAITESLNNPELLFRINEIRSLGSKINGLFLDIRKTFKVKNKNTNVTTFKVTLSTEDQQHIINNLKEAIGIIDEIVTKIFEIDPKIFASLFGSDALKGLVDTQTTLSSIVKDYEANYLGKTMDTTANASFLKEAINTKDSSSAFIKKWVDNLKTNDNLTKETADQIKEIQKLQADALSGKYEKIKNALITKLKASYEILLQAQKVTKDTKGAKLQTGVTNLIKSFQDLIDIIQKHYKTSPVLKVELIKQMKVIANAILKAELLTQGDDGNLVNDIDTKYFLIDVELFDICKALAVTLKDSDLIKEFPSAEVASLYPNATWEDFEKDYKEPEKAIGRATTNIIKTFALQHISAFDENLTVDQYASKNAKEIENFFKKRDNKPINTNNLRKVSRILTPQDYIGVFIDIFGDDVTFFNDFFREYKNSTQRKADLLKQHIEDEKAFHTGKKYHEYSLEKIEVETGGFLLEIDENVLTAEKNKIDARIKERNDDNSKRKEIIDKNKQKIKNLSKDIAEKKKNKENTSKLEIQKATLIAENRSLEKALAEDKITQMSRDSMLAEVIGEMRFDQISKGITKIKLSRGHLISLYLSAKREIEMAEMYDSEDPNSIKPTNHLDFGNTVYLFDNELLYQAGYEVAKSKAISYVITAQSTEGESTQQELVRIIEDILDLDNDEKTLAIIDYAKKCFDRNYEILDREYFKMFKTHLPKQEVYIPFASLDSNYDRETKLKVSNRYNIAAPSGLVTATTLGASTPLRIENIFGSISRHTTVAANYNYQHLLKSYQNLMVNKSGYIEFQRLLTGKNSAFGSDNGFKDFFDKTFIRVLGYKNITQGWFSKTIKKIARGVVRATVALASTMMIKQFFSIFTISFRNNMNFYSLTKNTMLSLGKSKYRRWLLQYNSNFFLRAQIKNIVGLSDAITGFTYQLRNKVSEAVNMLGAHVGWIDSAIIVGAFKTLVEEEMANNPDITEYEAFEIANERLDEVLLFGVANTDSAYRSHFSGTDEAIEYSISRFASENVLQVSGLIRKTFAQLNGVGDLKKLLEYILAFIFSALGAAIVDTIRSATRGYISDEKEFGFELLTNFGWGNIIGAIPYTNVITQMFDFEYGEGLKKGYEPKVYGLNDVWQLAVKITELKNGKNIGKKILDISEITGSMFGIPIRNASRIAQTIGHLYGLAGGEFGLEMDKFFNSQTDTAAYNEAVKNNKTAAMSYYVGKKYSNISVQTEIIKLMVKVPNARINFYNITSFESDGIKYDIPESVDKKFKFYSQNALKTLIKSASYRKLTNEDKIKTIQRIINYYYNYMKAVVTKEKSIRDINDYKVIIEKAIPKKEA